ncbi:LysR family transcriptional regulator [Vineibacter terrae]|uniref:LysR family transcriptional regulator n=1 Tax=Vineibacter terrae TaxID=2586908 RepID=UPI002E34A2E4|nr:LysR family transcriptional regulator [Vineibacter terrae]HEX2890596.1 LysR family transcriptional regulator [Vineibacter terrae]
MRDIDHSHIRLLDGSLLLVFRELSRTRRTTEAARRLGLTQSTVSHALARLRDLFDDPLFVRRPHGLEPTRRALELAPRIDALIDMADAVMGHDGDFDPARSDRRFRIAAAEFVMALIGAKLAQAFAQQAPQASFSVEFLLGRASLDSLRRGETDLVLGQFLALPPGFEAETLYEDGYCVVARKRHPRVKGTIDAATYASLPNIFVGPSGETGITDATLPSRRVVSTVALVPRWLTALTMVAGSDAIATCPRRLAERQAKSLGLQVIDTRFAGPRFMVSAVRRAGHADAGLDWLLSAIRAAV